ncbi:DcrB-related protein [Kosakonia cowanii]|uniref:DcrB-related protein n=1 Tax=Kosakonia cowanii TaxID=208223 RepID=UPI001F50152A|nr:DcrB-related protein [Kosakonia cowanii]
MFTPPGADAPALNISRDTQNSGETLAAYIDRQMALMAKHLKGWKTGKRTEAVLGGSLAIGEIIHASYLRDGKRTFQQQAVYHYDALGWRIRKRLWKMIVLLQNNLTS